MFAASGMMLAGTALGRIQPVMDAPTLPVPEQPQAPRGNRVVFRDVSLPTTARSPALSHVSFTAEPGETSGAGGAFGRRQDYCRQPDPPRFWDTDTGTVEVVGVDVRRIDPHVLMDQVAFVFQNNRLIPGQHSGKCQACPPRRQP